MADDSSAVQALSKVQLRTLMGKNVLLYRRQSSLVFQELLNVVMYYGILVALSFTAPSGGSEALVGGAHVTSIGGSGNSSLLAVKHALCGPGFTSCKLGFFDNSTGADLCSPALSNFTSSLALCDTARSSVICACVAPYPFR